MSSIDLSAFAVRLEQVEKKYQHLEDCMKEQKNENEDLKQKNQHLEECMEEQKKENEDLKQKIQHLEELQRSGLNSLKEEIKLKHPRNLEDLKEHSIFSARLKLSGPPDWVDFKHVDKWCSSYKESSAFDKTTCRFTAPEKGDYFLNLGMRQTYSRGSLEVILLKQSGSGYSTIRKTPIYVGRTCRNDISCNKSTIVTLEKTDTVEVRVKRLAKQANVVWVVFEGYLIAST